MYSNNWGFANGCRTISYFSDLLDNEDKAVCIAASVALALIFETNCLQKFTTHENVISEKQEQKNKIMGKLRRQSNVLLDVLNYFEVTDNEMLCQKFLKYFGY